MAHVLYRLGHAPMALHTAKNALILASELLCDPEVYDQIEGELLDLRQAIVKLPAGYLCDSEDYEIWFGVPSDLPDPLASDANAAPSDLSAEPSASLT